MRTEYLREFIVWAESRTVQEAALKVHLSQSTMSKHLIALEKEIGVSLIEHGDKNELTPAGICLYNGAVDFLRRLDDTVKRCRSINDGTESEIRVWDAFVYSGAMSALEGYMRGFQNEHACSFRYALKSVPYKTPHQAFVDGDVDVAIEYRPLGRALEDTPNSDAYALVKERLVLWCSKSHPLARKEVLSPREIEHVPIMCSIEMPYPLQDSITALCVERGFEPTFYRFNPTSQASFFFEAPIECVYLLTPDLLDDKRISLRNDMVARRFDDPAFAVESYVVVRKSENDALARFSQYIGERADGAQADA